MIGKITTGSDFRGLVDYLLEPTKEPQVLTTNLFPDRLDMIWELELCAQQNTRCKKPVKHISIGFAPEDGKVLDQTIYDVVDGVLEGLGYNENQFLVVRHGRIDPSHDRPHAHDHFHILINMIDYDGNRVKDSFDKKTLEKILREQESEQNLTPVESSIKRQYKGATTGQAQRMMREVEEYENGTTTKKPNAPYTLKIQSGIDLASHDRPSLRVFLARLQQLEIDTKFKIEDEEIQGISYRLHDFKIRGCKLHNASLNRLREHRVELEPEEDAIAVEMVNAGEQLELAPELRVNWTQANIRDYLPDKLKQKLDESFGKKEAQPMQKAGQSQTVTVETVNEVKKVKDWEIDL